MTLRQSERIPMDSRDFQDFATVEQPSTPIKVHKKSDVSQNMREKMIQRYKHTTLSTVLK